jgi:hypothetical protein
MKLLIFFKPIALQNVTKDRVNFANTVTQLPPSSPARTHNPVTTVPIENIDKIILNVLKLQFLYYRTTRKIS